MISSKSLSSLFCILSLVDGHARLTSPAGRSTIDHGNNESGANGPSACGGGEGSQWSVESTWTDSMNWDIRADYPAGSIIEIGLVFSAPHCGHFRLELCDPFNGIITNECFQPLPRDPTNILWSPFLPEYPFDFFIPDNTCTMTFTESSPLTAKFRLPPVKICPHCVIRVFWQTGNSCLNHPATSGCQYDGCIPTDPRIAAWSSGQCKTAVSPVSNSCGINCPNDNCTNELFKICADVSIGGGTTGGVQPTHPPTLAPKITTTTRAPSGDDPVAYCKQHVTADYDSWKEECIAGCGTYQVWCSQSQLTTGPQLLDCLLTINGNCKKI